MEEPSGIGKTKGDWNKEKIHAYFHNEDIPWILGTPVDTQEEDVLTWPFSPNRHYLVKSGYRVARELNICPTRCSNMDQINTWWKMWWHLQLPSRIKLFGWKLCHNWLPAKSNLIHRGMTLDPLCNQCGGTMFDILVEIRHQLSKEEFEELYRYPEGQSELLAGPPDGVYCVHCDAALIPGKEGVGLGFIWTNWSGKIMAAGMQFLPHLCSVIIAEAEAVLAALKDYLIDTNSRFEVRTDCKKLVDEFNGDCDSLITVRPVINKIKRHQRYWCSIRINTINDIEQQYRKV
ncbi:hypothetical protein G4B88_021015 [Cannabis sativa]|uniref:RNase H type-1 domain-containing protein n=1 Tax=Cannabis sativa TaxID=3483 RepID=A0A7J6GAM6_CANSA|nr:hypothetical protein G4B88_021015 [Cannabis sativa]